MIRIVMTLLVSSMAVSGQTASFATGLLSPNRLLFTPHGNLLVTEGGVSQAGVAQPNTGRLSIIDPRGNRRTLLDGLPSGPAHFTTPFGPTSMALSGSTLYVLLGEGDVMSGTPPTVAINPRGPSSPIFSSILKIRFTPNIDQAAGGFRLTEDDHWRLYDGGTLDLRSAGGDRVEVEILTMFRPLVRNWAGAAPVRPSDPYGLVFDERKQNLYVADASGESVVKVNVDTGRSQLVVRFPPIQRTTPTGTVAADNVPTGICRRGDDLLVGFLTGAPFPAGQATVKSVDARTGAVSTVISGLTALVDVVCGESPDGRARVFTLEWTRDFAQQMVPSGRLMMFEGAAGRPLASELALPTGMAQDPVTGQIFVAQYYTGQILRVAVP